VGAASLNAARIRSAGDLGWELTTEAARAVAVWDVLRAAGRAIDPVSGLEPFGYRALDGLRMEKGYRYFGTDMTLLETPEEAGLGSFVRLDKAPFIGRDALRDARDPVGVSRPRRRLATILIGDDGYVPVYGGEAVRANGQVIGRLRSVAYGPTVSRTIGYVYRSAELAEGATLTVDVFDEHTPAMIAADVLVDPDGARMRG
jgi:glycine cleavage system aminomethyltransferase T